MPDWTYTTLLAPLFRRFPDDAARRFVNGYLKGMTSLPGGSRVLDLMGHMEPPEEISTQFLGLTLPSPVILAPAIDPEGVAAKAFDKFGFGAMVVGPVSRAGHRQGRFERGDERTLRAVGSPRLAPSEVTGTRLQSSRLFLEVFLEPEKESDLASLLEEIVGKVEARIDAVIVSPQTKSLSLQNLSVLSESAKQLGIPLLLGLADNIGVPEALEWARACHELGLGLWISGRPTAQEGWEWGGQVERVQALTRELREAFPTLPLAVDSGVLEPAQAIALREAGADLIGVSAGLVHTGPGFPKRINDLLLYYRGIPAEASSREPVERTSWFWALILGLSLLFGAGLAGWVAMTDVVLPYDEEFCGKTAPEIAAFNPRILSFMVHDRITLSGTMVSVGALYVALALFEIRKGSHWAQRAVQVSAVSGFFSFFAFLGYGYFDPFHAMVAAILCQFLIQLSVQPVGPGRRDRPGQSCTNDRVWRQAMWAQLLFVVHASALILAGLTILTFGVTEVFVPQDIEFLGMDAGQLAQFDLQLKALIAHDRATFGGMLVSAGIALLLTTLWGFRRGDAWLWWTYLLVMLEPYLLTLWIHRSIGYWNQFHLLPVYIGIVLLVCGLALSRSYFLKMNPVGP